MTEQHNFMLLKFDKTFFEFTTFCSLDVEKISREIGLLINSDGSSKKMINFLFSGEPFVTYGCYYSSITIKN